MSDFSDKKQKILSCIRNYDIYYIEFKLIIHPFAIYFTYFFHLIKFSPNNVSFINLLVSSCCLYYFYFDHFLISFILYWFRTVLDYSDGALARFNSQSSKFGKYLDLIIDWLFYPSLWILIILNKPELWFLAFLLLFYVLTVDFYIEPRIKLLKKRASLKEYFMQRGLLIGFAPFGLFEMWLLFLFSIFSFNDQIFVLLSFLVFVDLIYRLYETVRYSY